MMITKQMLISTLATTFSKKADACLIDIVGRGRLSPSICTSQRVQRSCELDHHCHGKGQHRQGRNLLPTRRVTRVLFHKARPQRKEKQKRVGISSLHSSTRKPGETRLLNDKKCQRVGFQVEQATQNKPSKGAT